MFHEQVSAISQWFTEWTEAEQMVLLYSLLKRLSTLQVKFLSRVVDQHLTDCAELQLLEQQANNPAFITSLLTKGKDMAINQLLIYLPLLRPDNVEAKSRYLAIIPSVLSHSVDTGDHLPEAKQLISYSLIHPAILSEDRKQLTPWVQILKARFNLLSSTSILPLSESSNSWNNQQQRHSKEPANVAHCNPQQQVRVRRSNSLTPPVSLCQSTELWTSQDDLCAKQKPRSYSLSSEHGPPLSPQSSQASSGSGSETQLDETKSFTSDFPGMRDVGTWLKALRLHKYIWLFSQLSYDEMLALTEEKLEAAGVTKGARHKIVLSIRKLKDRYNTLCQMEEEVIHGTNLMSVLEELKTMLCSPIKPMPVTTDLNETENKTDIDDIPSQFTKVLGKVCSHLIINGGREEDTVRLATWLLEKCLSHESFLPYRRRLETWRLQVNALWQHTHHRQKWHHNQSHFSNPNSSSGHSETRAMRRSSTASYQNRGLYLLPPTPYQPNLRSPQVPVNPYSLSHLVSPTNVTSHNIPFQAESQPQNMLQSEVQTSLGADKCRQTTISDKQSESDINSKLEDLCLTMAEHFLEGVS
ncbi:hypothetical protein RUM43_011357 [Polyplax serrata]|uniref:Protein Smaug n=1 Tax=Polyplax serrata TaxID=468196 RepID=A0AAN8P514_POLSC